VTELLLQFVECRPDSLWPDAGASQPGEYPGLGERDEGNVGATNVGRRHHVEQRSAVFISTGPTMKCLSGDTEMAAGIGHGHERSGEPHVRIHESAPAFPFDRRTSVQLRHVLCKIIGVVPGLDRWTRAVPARL
jgi:hypothetical protein